jgi:hypothetical protein
VAAGPRSSEPEEIAQRVEAAIAATMPAAVTDEVMA